MGIIDNNFETLLKVQSQVQSGSNNNQVNGDGNIITTYNSSKSNFIDLHNAAKKICSAINGARFQMNDYLRKSPKYGGDISTSWRNDKRNIKNAITANASQFDESTQKKLLNLADQLSEIPCNNTTKEDINNIFDRMESILKLYIDEK